MLKNLVLNLLGDVTVSAKEKQGKYFRSRRSGLEGRFW